jgi:probable rRNA maturation factor
MRKVRVLRRPADAIVDVQNACRDCAVPQSRTIARWARAALGNMKGVELAVRIVGEAEGTDLNRRWRGRKQPTNVLSFPAADVGDVTPRPLGDVVICAPVVTREATERNSPPEAHWAHMIVHGTLHLLGHDHVDRQDADRMQALETEILGSLGFPDPWS